MTAAFSEFGKDILSLIWPKARQEAVPLERTRPEFTGLGLSLIENALAEDGGQNPVRVEVKRLARLYTPRLQQRTRALKPLGTLRLDIRCPIEKVAADLVFHALATKQTRESGAVIY